MPWREEFKYGLLEGRGCKICHIDLCVIHEGRAESVPVKRLTDTRQQWREKQ